MEERGPGYHFRWNNEKRLNDKGRLEQRPEWSEGISPADNVRNRQEGSSNNGPASEELGLFRQY